MWISDDHERNCSYDTTSRKWSYAGGRIGKLLGRVEHVPESDRFVSSGDNQLFCVADIEERPTLEDRDNMWEEEAPEEEPRGWSPDFARESAARGLALPPPCAPGLRQVVYY
ncbi:hypothetical protein D1007_04099 [Hordeum vulgare]|nr:hypothetical protein D1007_04099 [Hordeum vulgare]